MHVLLAICVLSTIVGEVVWCKEEEAPCTLYHNVAIGSQFCRLQCKGENCESGKCVFRKKKRCLCINCKDKGGDNLELDVLRGKQ